MHIKHAHSPSITHVGPIPYLVCILYLSGTAKRTSLSARQCKLSAYSRTPCVPQKPPTNCPMLISSHSHSVLPLHYLLPLSIFYSIQLCHTADIQWASLASGAHSGPSAKRNSSYSTYSILFLTYTSYFGGKKGISRNKMNFFFLMPG